MEVGIGDDGAVIRCDSSHEIVVTDMLLEGRHFETATTSPELIGRKAVAVNLSDLAAMGCWPTAAFVSIAVPTAWSDAAVFLDKMYGGIEGLSQRYQFSVAGGDTNSWEGPFVINVALTGVPCGAKPILRSGAKAGDVLLVTGPLGGSFYSGRHLTFEPRLNAARWLAGNSIVHAMMDISDGLAIDLHRMMEASATGAVIDADAVPISNSVDESIEDAARLQRALSDGEDFELLLAVPIDEAERLRSSVGEIGCDMIAVGRVTDDPDILIARDGRHEVLPVLGWQHL